jgi:AraC-like DNA-binding protein
MSVAEWRGWERLAPLVRYANFWDASAEGWDFGPRYVQEFQILFVQGGRGTAEVAGERREIVAGDVVFYGPHERHEVRSSRDEPLRLVGLVFIFHADDVRQLDERAGHAQTQPFRYPRGVPACPLKPRPPAFSSTAAGGAMRRHAEALVLSWISDHVGRGLERRGLLLLLLDAWWRELSAARAPLDARHRRAVEDALRALDAALAAPPSLEALAAKAGLSADNLARAVKRATGLSVGAYVHEQRLLRARRLLVEGRLAVAEVAGAVGYADPFYFTRRFTRRFGLPPSELRRRHAVM